MATKKRAASRPARTPDDIADLLELTDAERALMKAKADISKIAVQAIEESGLPINEIVKRSGVARSKVSAVKNGATVSVSIDLLVKIIAATGTKLKVRAA